LDIPLGHPEAPGQPDVAEAAEPLALNVLELNQHWLVVIGLVVVRWIEE